MRDIALFLPSLAGGGAERVFVELANETAMLGFRVDLVLASASGPYLSEISPAVTVVDLGSAGVLSAFPKLVRYLRSRRPKVILSGLDHANIVTIMARLVARGRTRCVISVRAVPSAVYGSLKTIRAQAVFRLMGIAYPFADAIIANSDAVAADLAHLVGAVRNKLHVIYNPLDIQRITQLSEEPIEHPWCEGGGAPIVMSVGSLTLLKDFSTLVNAFAITRSQRECRLVILGEGPERQNLESMIRDLGLNDDVYLPGFVSNPFAWMRYAKVFVSSSVTEGCPNALMQALACGTPVVSTNCGGSAEILERGKWGSLVEVGDSHAMADAILTMLSDSPANDVRARALHFAPDKILRRYLEVMLPDNSGSMAER